MIYLGIVKVKGRYKVKCRKKDGTEKTYKSTREVRDYARENFKSGDYVIAKFDDKTFEMVKLSKSKPYSGNKGNRGTSKEMTEMSVYKTVGTIVAGLEDVTVKNVEKIVEKLYEQGLALVRGKKADVEEETTEEESVEEETAGEEEPEE